MVEVLVFLFTQTTNQSERKEARGEVTHRVVSAHLSDGVNLESLGAAARELPVDDEAHLEIKFEHFENLRIGSELESNNSAENENRTGST